MFLRVISYEKTEGEKTGKVHQSLYECKRVHISQGDKLDDDGESLEVRFAMEDPDISLLIGKAGRRVYIMNNAGDTIDSYVW